MFRSYRHFFLPIPNPSLAYVEGPTLNSIKYVLRVQLIFLLSNKLYLLFFSREKKQKLHR